MILASGADRKRVSWRERYGEKGQDMDYLVVFLTAITMAICARMIQRTLSEE